MVSGVGRRAVLKGGVAGVLGGMGQRAGAAPAVTVLRYSDHEPLGGMRTRFLKDVLFPAIERESAGRLRVEDHWNGELAIAYDALAAVGERRTVDLATVVPEYFAAKLPLHQLFKSFPTGPAGAQQVDFFQRAYAQAPGFAAELRASGAVDVFLGTGYPVAFFGREPLQALPGIRGGKWRTASFWHRDFLRNAGATPVTMPWGPGIYDALRAGSLDGLMVNVDSGYMLKVHEAAPHVLISRELWLGHLYVLAMNQARWDALPAQDQAAIRRAAAFAYGRLGDVMDQHLAQQIELLTAGDARVRVLTRAEVQQWAEVTQYARVQDAWVAAQRAQGVTRLEDSLAVCRALLGHA